MYDRPRVFSLWGRKPLVSRFTNIDVMAELDIFAQYAAYDVILPICSEQEHLLNIFETTVLKLANLSINSNKRISELVCFDDDLVQFIQYKLLSLGFVEKDYSISQEGKAYLDELQETKRNIKNTVGKIFTDKVTGKLLPYVHIGEISYEDVVDCDGRDIRIKVGSAGNSRLVNGDMIINRSAQNTIGAPPRIKPTPRDVLKTISVFNRLCRNHPGVSMIKIDPSYMIDISSSAETVYIHNKLVLQRGNIDSIIVSDGFSLHNEIVAELLRRDYSKIIGNLIKYAKVSGQQPPSGEKFISKKYYEVERLLTPPEDVSGMADARKGASGRNSMKLADYYGAVEWSLQYHLKINPIDQYFLELYRPRTAQENADVIASLSISIGLPCNDRVKFLFAFSSANVSHFEHGGSPELQTVLSLSIAQAKYDPNSALHNVVREFPDILQFLAELKTYRDSKSHSGGESKDFSVDEILDRYEKTKRFVSLMLSDFESHESAVVQKGDASQSLINADVALAGKLGMEYYSQTDKEAKDLLRQISPDKHASQLPEPFAYIMVLSKLLELVMRNAISELLFIGGNTHSTNINDAIGKVALLCKAKCPASLSTVRLEKFDNAIKGKNSTLGGYTLAFAALLGGEIDEDGLKDMVGVVDRVLRLRRHGNDIRLSISDNSLIELFDDVMKTLLFIGGVK